MFWKHFWTSGVTADEVLGFVGHCAVSLFGTNKPRGPKWYREDPQILVWALTSTEVLSALYRRFREGRLTSRELSDCCQQVHTPREDWSEVGDVELVKQRAGRLL